MEFARRENVEDLVRTIFRRCAKCDDVTPSCFPCPDGQVCSIIPRSCGRCARTECLAVGPPRTSTSSSEEDDGGDGPNAGVIAGSLIGGIIFVCGITYLVWRFCIKKRQSEEEYSWDESYRPEEKESDFTMRRDARASTHTVASMASTVLTRASNIIQIAYIPGVTNRSGPSSPQPLVPPVPPIPALTSPSHQSHGPYSPSEDQHFFVPGDLRGSTWSGVTDNDGQSTFARQSVAPSLARESVVSTVYRNDAVVSPRPAQTIVRGKAAVVSVKSNPTSADDSPTDTPHGEAPPLPSMPDLGRFAHRPSVLQTGRSSSSPSSAGSSGRQILSPGGSVRGAEIIGRPVPLNITKKKSGTSLASTSTTASPSTATTIHTYDSFDPQHASTATNPAIHAALAAASSTRPLGSVSPNPSARSATASPPLSACTSRTKSPLRLFPTSPSPASFLTADSPGGATGTEDEDENSPFADARNGRQYFHDRNRDNGGGGGGGSIDAAIKTAVKRASRTTGGGAGPARNRSPFGDENALNGGR